VTAPDAGFSVTYALAKYQPATVQVQVVHNPGDLSTPATTVTDPNPVFAELQPAGPPPKAHRMRPKRAKRQTPAAAAPADTPFPDPNAAPPPGSPAPSR
jgi:hypothetical protein